MNQIYIKQKGYKTYYRATVSVRTSNRGYLVATMKDLEKVTEYAYYKQPQYNRYILDFVREGKEIHEIGNIGFFTRLAEGGVVSF